MSDPRVRPVTKAGSQEALKVGIIANNIRMQQMQQRPQQQQQQQPIPTPQQVSILPTFLPAAFMYKSDWRSFFLLTVLLFNFSCKNIGAKALIKYWCN